jgi:2-polyprenyl-3-methyl-5-hydroxy-6-metoxy-1,4-benzoquinol methylase
MDAGLIDVRQLIKEVSVEEWCRGAEEFFARRSDWSSLQAKPFSEISEAPELLTCFVQVVQGLKLLPDMTVLDFGAGSCWTSRFLSQLGLRVIALDVSASALKMGRELYRRHPLIGHQPPPQFLQFDGHSFDLPDESVDRITCWESFHHVPNPGQVIREMGRVLKPGGIAGFSEPGPEHSKAAQSQQEMRTNKVLENDVDVREIWREAQGAGFTEMKLALFNPQPFSVPLEEFEAFLSGQEVGAGYVAEMRREMQQRRLFFLYKGRAAAPADSRQREGLRAELQVTLASTRVAAGKALRLKAVVKNTGSAVWLPTPEAARPWWQVGFLARLGRRPHMGPDRVPPRVGGVRFGMQLFDDAGGLLDIDYFRYHLTPGAGREIAPGETVSFAAEVPMPPPGNYVLHCDLVSEAVTWFEHNGSPPVRLKVEVI